VTLHDDKLKFEEEEHVYTVDDVPLTSVTTFVGQFFPKFDADAVAEKKAYSYGQYKDLSKEEILAKWNKKAQDGTTVHEQIELAIKGQQFLAEPRPRAKHGIEYWKQLKKKHLFAEPEPELRVYSEKYKIAGTIDLPYRHENGNGGLKPTYSLVDWKTNKKIYQKAYKGKKGTHKITENLEACNYVKYTLQLSTYAYILEQEYGVTVADLVLCHVEPNKYTAYKVPYRYSLVKRMLETRL
jgi:hypothetical protein